MKSLFVTLILILLSSAVGHADGCITPTLTEKSAIGWAKEDFDGGDTSFKRIRREVDSIFSESKNIASVLSSYKSTAQKNPTDAQSQFRWAYIAYLTSDHWRREVRSTKILCGVFEWMGQPTNPRSFEYSRLRFIVARLDSNWGSNRYIVDMGERLLQKADKNDFDLRYFVLQALSGRGGIKDAAPYRRALELALQLHEDFPERTEPYYTLGGIYGSLFVVEKSSRLADLSIRYTREYLALSPVHEGRRKGAVRRIESMERRRNRLKDKGELKP